jgi:hypothetical protein
MSDAAREMTPERMTDVRAVLTSARCSYVGRCNSGRCPVHGVHGVAVADLLAHVDALTARAEAAERMAVDSYARHQVAAARDRVDQEKARAEAAEKKLAALVEAFDAMCAMERVVEITTVSDAATAAWKRFDAALRAARGEP